MGLGLGRIKLDCADAVQVRGGGKKQPPFYSNMYCSNIFPDEGLEARAWVIITDNLAMCISFFDLHTYNIGKQSASQFYRRRRFHYLW